MAPVYLKLGWKGFYIAAGVDFNLPFYVYNTHKGNVNKVYKGEFNDKKLLISAVLKVGYDLKIKRNVLFFDFVLNQDLKKFDRQNTYNNKRLNIGIGLGYKFNLSKKQL